ncbi:hypothetical protein T4D_4442 [Trichinella pseudospiralis]|uniref:Uncharacterized protein n=1 Tax=Trichinella pseudospiralis TaxID=6337 RepID=A0A0V1FX73_TRIPS|nr:hypothetical protein T4D_4442 [Trichinella pseudospiralis]
MEHDHIVIDGGLWRGTGFEDTDGHCLASFTFVPLEQILKHCICDPLRKMVLVIMSALCCIISVVAHFLYLFVLTICKAVTYLRLSCHLENIQFTQVQIRIRA